MEEGQSANESFTLWMTVAVLAMTALALLVILIFRLALKRVWEEREKMRKTELEHQQKLLFNSIHIQERERERIAANLHDELTSRLNVLRLSLYNPTGENAEQMQKLLDETIGLSRDLSHDLYPPLLTELGWTETVKDYLHPISQQVPTHFIQTGKGELHDRQVALQLFRIVQELLQNTLKHAGATEIGLHLRTSATGAALVLRDNGKGFNPESAKGGLGLANIESRVQMLNGAYKLKSRPGAGTTAIVCVPQPPKASCRTERKQ